MASRRRGKGRRKVGRKSAGWQQPDPTSKEVTQPDRPLLVKPAHPFRLAPPHSAIPLTRHERFGDKS